jgi:hypothetical protein
MLALSHLQFKADGQTQPAESALGAGQHYGLATNLIDFTLDPLTAAFFAVDSDRFDLSPEAAVYWLPLYRAYELGAAIVIPPYWVERLYRQRGCFIDAFQLAVGTRLKEECFSIRFPRDRAYCASDFGNLDDRLYPESLWLQKAVRWAQDSAERSGLASLSNESAKAFADELVSFAGEPDFIAGSLDFGNGRKQLELLVEVLEWLSVSLNQSDGEAKLDMDCQIINALARQNPGVFAAFRFGKQFSEAPSPDSDQFSKYFHAVLSCLEHADAQVIGKTGSRAQQHLRLWHSV